MHRTPELDPRETGHWIGMHVYAHALPAADGLSCGTIDQNVSRRAESREERAFLLQMEMPTTHGRVGVRAAGACTDVWDNGTPSWELGASMVADANQ